MFCIVPKNVKKMIGKSIKNIVSSDRIQELPDANAAEAVARVPGVSIRRRSSSIRTGPTPPRMSCYRPSSHTH